MNYCGYCGEEAITICTYCEEYICSNHLCQDDACKKCQKKNERKYRKERLNEAKDSYSD